MRRWERGAVRARQRLDARRARVYALLRRSCKAIRANKERRQGAGSLWRTCLQLHQLLDQACISSTASESLRLHRLFLPSRSSRVSARRAMKWCEEHVRESSESQQEQGRLDLRNGKGNGIQTN